MTYTNLNSNTYDRPAVIANLPPISSPVPLQIHNENEQPDVELLMKNMNSSDQSNIFGKLKHRFSFRYFSNSKVCVPDVMMTLLEKKMA